MFDSEQFISIFLNEAEEIVEGLENDLVLLEDNKSDEELLNKIFRSAHTLKSSAGTVGFDAMSDLNHVAENLLEKVRSGKLDVTPEMITVLLEFLDTIKLMLQNIVDGNNEADGITTIETLKVKIKTIADGDSLAVPTPTTATKEKKETPPSNNENETVSLNIFHIGMKFKDNIFDNGIDPTMFLSDLSAIGTISNLNLDTSNIPSISNFEDPYICYTSFSLDLDTYQNLDQVCNLFLFVIDDNDITITHVASIEKPASKVPGYISAEDNIRKERPQFVKKENSVPEVEVVKEDSLDVEEEVKQDDAIKEVAKPNTPIKAAQMASTVRVDTRKLDTMMNLVGELVIAQSRITQVAVSVESNVENGLKEAVASLDRITRQIQEEVMNIRMMPIGPIFSQFHRYVRDLSLELNKEIKLVLKGETTEIDKNMLEQLSDPLKHIIRNSIDHGIEKTKEERVERNKPEYGTITLSAAHQEGHVVIEVADDGNGLDKEKIYRKGIEKGLLSKDVKYADSDIYKTIFAPGFSTADVVTDISGRGVGMDVVRVNVEKLKGRIEIKSDRGVGSSFLIKLPLTLAIIEGITLSLGNEIYVMPLLSIVEQLKVKNGHVKPFEEKGEMINIRGEYIPLIRLHNAFQVKTDVVNIEDGIVVVAEAGNTKCAVFVDELLDQQQAVIKSLDASFGKHSGIAGGTILGDGKIALIIDIQGLVNTTLQGKIGNSRS